MKFSNLRHRIVFLKPTRAVENELGESVPLWLPYHPVKGAAETGAVYVTEEALGEAVFTDADGNVIEKADVSAYEVWAGVAPTTGREYDEAQKLRAETTYNVITRYFLGITPDMKILFRGRIMNIVSVLNIDERCEQLKIVATERVEMSGV